MANDSKDTEARPLPRGVMPSEQINVQVLQAPPKGRFSLAAADAGPLYPPPIAFLSLGSAGSRFSDKRTGLGRPIDRVRISWL